MPSQPSVEITAEHRIAAGIVSLGDEHLPLQQQQQADSTAAAAAAQDSSETISRDAQLAEDASKLAGSLREFLGQDANRTAIVATVLDCAKALPAKQPLYACLAGLLSEISREFATELCEALGKAFQASVEEEPPSPGPVPKLLLRFAAGLVDAGVLSAISVSQFFDAVLVSAAELAVGGVTRAADFLVHAVVLAMPTAGPILAAQDQDGFRRVMESLAAAFSTRSGVSIAPYSARTDEVPREDGLAQAWAAVHSLAEEEDIAGGTWTHLGCVIRPSAHFAARFEAIPKIDLSPISIPPSFSPASVPFAIAPFSLFGGLPLPLKPIEKLVLEDLIVDTMHSFSDSAADAARHIAAIPVAPETTFPYSLLIETIYGQMFTLPEPRLPPIFYQSLLLRLAKTDKPFTLAQVDAMRSIIQCIESLDVECVDRFAECFAWHLSNYNFLWTWNDM
jgi:nuclear cap-binding protein subunit 1